MQSSKSRSRAFGRRSLFAVALLALGCSSAHNQSGSSDRAGNSAAGADTAVGGARTSNGGADTSVGGVGTSAVGGVGNASGAGGSDELGGGAGASSPAAGNAGGSGGLPPNGAAGASIGGAAAASDGKQKVLAYLASISGKQTIFGIENKGTLHSDVDKVRSIVGKQPGFWGNDFGFGSGALNQRPAMATEAVKQWNAGAIVGLMYHACAPTRDELCTWDDIGGAAPQHLSASQWTDLVTPGTGLYQAWIARLEALSAAFQTLKDAGVAPLFRPFHEMNQCVFWWSCQSGSTQLYRITHDYLVKTKGFDNIIWVWNVQDFNTLGNDVTKYNPGSDYFDIAALDVYNTGYTSGNYNAMLSAAGGKFVAIAECQFMPSQAILSQQPKWLYAMLWPDFYGNNDLPTLYAAPSVLTEDEMPGWK